MNSQPRRLRYAKHLPAGVLPVGWVARTTLVNPNVSYWYPPDGWNRLPACSGRQLADQAWTGTLS